MRTPFSFDGLRTRGGASRALLTAAIPLSALALGGLHTPVLCLVTALLGAAAFASWYGGSAFASRLPATVLFCTGVALTAFTALQAMPLPAALVRALAPATGDVWARALSPLGEAGPAWAALSLDPLATRVQVVRGIAYLAAFVVALRIADVHGGATFLSFVVSTTAVVLGIAAVLHPMFGAHKVFGLYQPSALNIADRHIAPLLNANHLAAYLNIGFCLALGMALSRKRERYRPIFASTALLLGAIQIWVGSRGGTLAMLFGATIAILMARMSRRFTVRGSAFVVLPILAVATGVGMMIFGATADLDSELVSTDVSKISLALEGLRLVPHHAVFGVGRGAFEVAFPAVRTSPGYFIVTHPENLIVQWITEWGLPVAIAGSAAIAYALRPKVLVSSSSPAVGAWAAVAAVAVQNLVDFNSEVPAIGVATAVCAAMVVAGRGSTRPGVLHQWAMHPRGVGLAVGAAALLGILIVLPSWPHEIDEERRSLYRDVTQPEPKDDFPDVARSALARHPSEPYVPFIISVDASRRGRSVMPWVERAFELAPIYAPAHFVLAQQLAPLSPSQARLEYRLSISQTSDDPAASRALDQAARLVQSFDDALEVVPDGARRLGVLDRLSAVVEPRLPASRARLDAMILKIDPNSRGAIERTINDTLADLQAGEAAPWCAERTACTRAGISAAERLIALNPGMCGPLILRARLRAAADDAAQGLFDLEQGAQTARDSTECWRWMGDLAATSHNDVYAEAAEEHLARAGCGDDQECASNMVWVAELEERRGNPHKAMSFYARAHDRAPERRDIVERTARLARVLGMHAQALEAFQTLSIMTGDPKWQGLVDEEKKALYREVSHHETHGQDGGAPDAGRRFGSGLFGSP